MKTEIHPNYRPVVFQDVSSDLMFVVGSTIETSETIEYEGETYPLAKVEISSASHPFFTGKQILVDTGGRVERFRQRYGAESQTEVRAREREEAKVAKEAAAKAKAEAEAAAAAAATEEE